MTKEDKEILLRDLCARLPYGVMVKVIDHNDASYAHKGVLYCIENIDSDCNGTPCLFTVDGVGCAMDITEIKPYLRSLSSMTEKERKELRKMLCWDIAPKDCPKFEKDFSVLIFYSCNEREEDEYLDMGTMLSYFDYLNSHHFDYRGLIKKGLALEAPEGMYKSE